MQRPVVLAVWSGLASTGVVGWLALASPAAANDCVGVAETVGCFVASQLAAPLMLLGALLAVATAAAGAAAATAAPAPDLEFTMGEPREVPPQPELTFGEPQEMPPAPFADSSEGGRGSDGAGGT
jgi:hypothetical protein